MKLSSRTTNPGTNQINIASITKKHPLYNENERVSTYLANIAAVNESTAIKYNERSKKFGLFVSTYYNNSSVDNIVVQIKKNRVDVYNILGKYILYLKQSNNSISPNSLKNHIITIKNFLEYSDIDISPRKFKLKVRLPKIIRKNKEALSKEDVIDILNACSDIRLKTYVMFLAAGGFRAVEALSVRIKDLDLDAKPVHVFVRGEYTKTKADRVVFLTEEVTLQLKSWLNYKYRKRRVCHDQDERIVTEYRIPAKEGTDLLFAVYQTKRKPNPDGLYDDIAKSFAKTLDRMGKGDREDGNEQRRQITLHSFRRFVKTTISDLGYADYSEYFIGHAGSTYWRKKDLEKAEIFRKIEPYLTFLNVHQLERQGADIQTKIEELEELNQSMRDRDKMKDDAIAHLSDQLVAITTRLQELENRQIAA